MGILSEKGIMQHFITNVTPPIENKAKNQKTIIMQQRFCCN